MLTQRTELRLAELLLRHFDIREIHWLVAARLGTLAAADLPIPSGSLANVAHHAAAALVRNGAVDAELVLETIARFPLRMAPAREFAQSAGLCIDVAANPSIADLSEAYLASISGHWDDQNIIKRSFTADLVDLVKSGRSPVVITAQPGLGRTTLLRQLCRELASSGAPFLYLDGWSAETGFEPAWSRIESAVSRTYKGATHTISHLYILVDDVTLADSGLPAAQLLSHLLSSPERVTVVIGTDEETVLLSKEASQWPVAPDLFAVPPLTRTERWTYMRRCLQASDDAVGLALRDSVEAFRSFRDLKHICDLIDQSADPHEGLLSWMERELTSTLDTFGPAGAAVERALEEVAQEQVRRVPEAVPASRIRELLSLQGARDAVLEELVARDVLVQVRTKQDGYRIRHRRVLVMLLARVDSRLLAADPARVMDIVVAPGRLTHLINGTYGSMVAWYTGRRKGAAELQKSLRTIGSLPRLLLCISLYAQVLPFEARTEIIRDLVTIAEPPPQRRRSRRRAARANQRRRAWVASFLAVMTQGHLSEYVEWVRASKPEVDLRQFARRSRPSILETAKLNLWAFSLLPLGFSKVGLDALEAIAKRHDTFGFAAGSAGYVIDPERLSRPLLDALVEAPERVRAAWALFFLFELAALEELVRFAVSQEAPDDKPGDAAFGKFILAEADQLALDIRAGMLRVMHWKAIGKVRGAVRLLQCLAVDVFDAAPGLSGLAVVAGKGPVDISVLIRRLRRPAGAGADLLECRALAEVLRVLPPDIRLFVACVTAAELPEVTVGGRSYRLSMTLRDAVDDPLRPFESDVGQEIVALVAAATYATVKTKLPDEVRRRAEIVARIRTHFNLGRQSSWRSYLPIESRPRTAAEHARLWLPAGVSVLAFAAQAPPVSPLHALQATTTIGVGGAAGALLASRWDSLPVVVRIWCGGVIVLAFLGSTNSKAFVLFSLCFLLGLSILRWRSSTIRSVAALTYSEPARVVSVMSGYIVTLSGLAEYLGGSSMKIIAASVALLVAAYVDSVIARLRLPGLTSVVWIDWLGVSLMAVIAAFVLLFRALVLLFRVLVAIILFPILLTARLTLFSAWAFLMPTIVIYRLTRAATWLRDNWYRVENWYYTRRARVDELTQR